MDEEAKVIDWITSEVETESCTMQDYPVYHWGKRVIDRSGDYLIVYFHPLLEKVVYTFKGVEDCFFIAH
ncbi:MULTISPECIES: hypothetical protein [Bacillaceae]|uniref:hypothetical protein n=1 Tax=Bacillales TaxID=1385 RepID=UPI00188375FF|nr:MULTISPECIES: hypothetical protein [Bacillaceae]MBF0707988.1 hypothetical protein [Pseudalkalibacillus hwajinpoensis]MDO6654258.1 hypothetical protein [Anaerobacillus sp. 1_MG-2023]WLR59326.1 hypothetical protein LC071_19650 [Pseudalkalibacillus hwajinpoensis]